MYRDNNFALWLVSILILSLVGFAYAPIIMLFWNFLVVKILATASTMTYWQAYIVYLFFVFANKNVSTCSKTTKGCKFFF